MLKNKDYYVTFFILILLIEVVIACCIRDQFIRPFVGDALVVMLLYFGIQSFSTFSRLKSVVGVLLFAYGVEALQAFGLVNYMGWGDYSIARIILGTTFDWRDIVAYTTGMSFVLLIEYGLSFRRA